MSDREATMVSPSFRQAVIRILFLFAVITFTTGLLKFLGVRYRPLSMVHHYSGLTLAASSITHMVINKKALISALRFSRRKPAA